MAQPLLYLTYLGIIFIAGIFLIMISNKLKLPNALLLLAFGVFLNYLAKMGILEISFPPVFISSISLLALVVVVFDSSSRFKIKEIDSFSSKTLKFSLVFILLNLVFLSLLASYLFSIRNIFIVLIFSVLMSGTSINSLVSFARQYKNHISNFLQKESVLIAPFIILLPFVFLMISSSFSSFDSFPVFFAQSVGVLQQMISGVGSGIIVGLIFFKVMRRFYSVALSPIATIASALLAYVLAENIGGSGVFALVTLGLFFGNVFIKQKEDLHRFNFIFTNVLELFIFVCIGIIISLPLTADFFLKSISLFIVFLIMRFVSFNIIFPKNEYTLKEKIFITLSAPKGILECVVALSLSAVLIAQMDIILNLVLAFLIYSTVLSTIVSKFSRFFIRNQVI